LKQKIDIAGVDARDVDVDEVVRRRTD